MANISIPELSLIVLVGSSGSGKSTFARSHFKPTEIISSDFCRALITDDENDQAATPAAFDLLHTIAAKRLEAGKLVVIDATNVQVDARKPFIELAKTYHAVPVAIVFDLPEGICQDRNRSREDRQIPAGAVHRQIEQMRRGMRGMQKEGFRYLHTFTTPGQVEQAIIERQPTWTNRKNDPGPFDIIGDVHGCCDELETLLGKLGYGYTDTSAPTYQRLYVHPEGRKVIFLGDLVDRGPRILDTVQLARNMVQAGNALALPGNHDTKLVKKLRGRGVTVNHGMEMSLAEFGVLPVETYGQLMRDTTEFLDGLISHYVLDEGRLVVAHAGMKENMQGRASSRVRDFALYGETSGETDEFGLPVRYNWALEYRGKARVVYGHTPVLAPEWLNNTINIDTGCVFGGKLTALRYPEMELVSVPALREYSKPVRPLADFDTNSLTVQQQQEELLDIQDVLGKHVIETGLMNNISIPEGNSAAALEIMSRFIIDPRWLIYLPPTMSPPESTQRSGYLEHPGEAFAYYRKAGVERVICEEKHMGSRLVAVVCRNEETAARRFGVQSKGAGIFYTRTGRRFFDKPALEDALLERIRGGLTASGFWEEYQTDWVCLDCELMPWSVKAQELLQSQYAAVGAAGRSSLEEARMILRQAVDNGLPVTNLLQKYNQRSEMMFSYTEAYRQYCWPVNGVDELRLAPFHILATEGKQHTDKDHLWHLATIGEIVKAASSPSMMKTSHQIVDLRDPESETAASAWWERLTDAGGEGMVVKPLDYIARSKGRLLQPAVKCRGHEYLRIIYGPEYSTEEHLLELRQRSLSLKRALALKEFALGIESLERFVTRQPLRRVHECVFGVLALESEPVDPRL